MREYRSITFSEVELIRAIVDRRQQQRQALPTGTIRGATVVPDLDGTTLKTVILNVLSDEGSMQAVQVSPQEVAAALINHCLSRNVPIPKAAAKWVDVIEGEVALFMDIDDAAFSTRLAKAPSKGQAPRP